MAYPFDEDPTRRPYMTAMPSLRRAMGPLDNFASGVRQGWNSGQSMFDAGVAGLARATGFEDVAHDWERSADEQAAEAAQYANPSVQTAPWRDGGGGWANAAPWLLNQAGQLVGGAAPLVGGLGLGLAAAPLVPEAAGGAALASGLGMGLASLPQSIGANYQAVRDANQAQGLGDPTQGQAAEAAAWGVPSAALNAWAPTKAFGVGKTAAGAASRSILEGVKDVAKVGVDNAIATAGQKSIEHTFRPDMSSEDKQKEVIDSVVQGFIGGAGMGGVGEVAGRAIKAIRPDAPTQDLDVVTKQILEPEKAAQDVQDDGRNAEVSRQYEEQAGPGARAGQDERQDLGQEVPAAPVEQGIEGQVSFLDEGQGAQPQEVTPPEVPKQYLVEAERAARDGSLDQRLAAAEEGGDTLRSRAFGYMKSLLSDESGALKIGEEEGPQYPLASRDEWYGDANYDKTGGRLEYMTPDDYLSKARPMDVEETARENIDDLKSHIQSGKTLDPLALYDNGKEDGRHRAYAAKELGIDQVPVLNWRATEEPTGFRVDNPGGSWLRGKQEDAYRGSSKTAQKGLQGTPTAFAGHDEPLMLPVSELAKVKGVYDEVRKPGDVQYDELAQSVKENGYTNENPVMVFVNHKGEPYINEGNTRIAVAKDAGVDKIKAWVHWYNGAEKAPGKWTPSAVAAMERGQPKAPVITRDVGGAKAEFAPTPDGGFERIPTPADAKQPIDRPAGTPAIEGRMGVAPPVPPLPPRSTIPMTADAVVASRKPAQPKGLVDKLKEGVSNFAKDEGGALRIRTRDPEGHSLASPEDLNEALKRLSLNVKEGPIGRAIRDMGLYFTSEHHHDEMYGKLMPEFSQFKKDTDHREAISQRMQAVAMSTQAFLNDFARNPKTSEAFRRSMALEQLHALGMDPSQPWERQPQRVEKGDAYATYKKMHADAQEHVNWFKANPSAKAASDAIRTQYENNFNAKHAAVLYTLLKDTALSDDLRARLFDPSERFINDPEADMSPAGTMSHYTQSLNDMMQIAKEHLASLPKVKKEVIVHPTVDPETGKPPIDKRTGKPKRPWVREIEVDQDTTLGEFVKAIETNSKRLKDIPYAHLMRSGKYGLGFRIASTGKGADKRIDTNALALIRKAVKDEGFGNVIIEPLANQDYVFIRSDNQVQLSNLKRSLQQLQKAGHIKKEDFQVGTMDVFDKSPVASNVITKMIKQIKDSDRYKAPPDASPELKKSLEKKQAEMINVLNDMRIDLMPEASTAKSEIYREYIPGFEGDPLQALAKQSIEVAQHVSNLLGTTRVHDSLANMRKAWDASKDVDHAMHDYEPTLAALYSHAASREDERAASMGGSFQDKLQSMVFSKMLGFNPSTAILQLLQLANYGVPELAKKVGYMKATRSLAGSTADAYKVMRSVGDQAMKAGGLAIADMPITIDALKAAGLSHDKASFLIHVVNGGGIDTGGIARSLGHIAEARLKDGKINRGLDAYTRAASAMGYYAETLSRVQMALAAKEVYEAKHGKPTVGTPEWQKMVDYTHRTLKEALFDYSNSNRAKAISNGPKGLLGNSTKLAFVFQSYWMMATEKMYREVHALLADRPGMSPEDAAIARKEARTFLLGHLAATAAIAGTLGIPGMALYSKAYEKFKDWQDPEGGPHDMREAYASWLENTLGRDVGDAIAYGPARLLGTDVSSRTSERDFFPLPSFLYDSRGPWRQSFTKWALAKEGAGESAMADLFGAIDKYNAGDLIGAGAAILPAGLRNVVLAGQQAASGTYRDSRGHIVPNAKPTASNVASQLIGFKPTNLARHQEEDQMLRRYDTSIEYDASNLVAPMVKALRDGDQAAFNRMLPKAKEFERMHPGHKIVDRAKETYQREFRDLDKAEKTGAPYTRWTNDTKRKALVDERYGKFIERQ